MTVLENIKKLVFLDEKSNEVILITSTSDNPVLHITDGYYTLGLVKNDLTKIDQLMLCSKQIDISIECVIKRLLDETITIKFFNKGDLCHEN